MSIYKSFRRPGETDIIGGGNTQFNTLGARFDQPTYLSFKLIFGQGEDAYYNTAAQNINYDRMPHPLFAPKGNDAIEDRLNYSAIDYLYDANEYTRARMLEEFIQKFNIMQNEFQWYFQKIDGVADLLKIDPTKGIRVTSDKRLTLTTLEGLDLRMSHILNLYRKIAWDDTYQRWVLPDMMRYFTLKIFITEFRTFHGYNSRSSETDPEILSLSVLDNILPTWVINCEMCEFDLENIEYGYLSNLNVAEEPEQAGLTFGIKVGKIYEEQVFPIFRNMYLIDKYLNGFDRAKDKEQTNTQTYDPYGGEYGGGKYEWVMENFNSTIEGNNFNLSPEIYTAMAQELYAQDRTHKSSAAFNEQTNSKSLFGAQAAGPDGKLFTNDDNLAKIDPTAPNTWFANALSFGNSLLRNTVEEYVDKAKITPIPGLGLSFNEAKAALESKNIITALGIVRKAINTVAREYVQPSELLDSKTANINLVDAAFRNYLETISKSEATDDNQLIQEAANIALNDDGIWDQIKDFSRATDLVGEEELNANNPIQGGSNFEDNVNLATQGDKSRATDLVGEGEKNVRRFIQRTQLLEGAPSSTATTNKILKSE